MKRIAVPILPLFLSLVACFCSPAVVGQEQSSVPPPAVSVASHYLRAIDRSFSFPTVNGQEDWVLVGHSLSRSGAWRVIVVAGSKQPKVAWDSFALNDSYLDVIGLSFIDAQADGLNGYTVSLRGCAPHQCADGRIGFAVYASHNRRVYRSHVTTKEDGSYVVTFYPRSGIPESYRNQLSQMMCTDSSISQPSALAIKCSAK